MPDGRVADAPAQAAATKRDPVQQRDVVADKRRLADDHPASMIQQEAAPNLGPRVDVDVEQLRGTVLQRQRQRLMGGRREVGRRVADAM